MSNCPIKGNCIALPYKVIKNLSKQEQDRLVELALNVLEDRHLPGKTLTSAKETRNFLKLLLQGERNEVFGCIYLTAQHKIISHANLFTGTIDAATVYPRIVAQKCLEHNAAAVLFYHNHPSGDCTPSQADQQITRKLKGALALLDIRVLDHVIVGGSESSSMAELGMI